MVELSSHRYAVPALAGTRRRVFDQIALRARHAIRSKLGARRVKGLVGRVHYADKAWRSQAADAYRSEAIWFVSLTAEALHAAGRDLCDLTNVLEIGCGYGRVTRALAQRLRPRTLSVCDLDEQASAFTAREFDVNLRPIVEALSPRENGRYDLIIAASVYPWIDRVLIEMNIAKVALLLRVGGVFVFTTRGGPVSQTAGPDLPSLNLATLDQLLDREGFVCASAGPGDSESMSFIDRPVMEQIVQTVAPDLELLFFHPRDFAEVEDVYAYRKT
jgi:SAM-dependent methyltransferase